MAGYTYPGQYTTYGAYPPQQQPGTAYSLYGGPALNAFQQAAPPPQQPQQPQTTYAYQQAPYPPLLTTAVIDQGPYGLWAGLPPAAATAASGAAGCFARPASPPQRQPARPTSSVWWSCPTSPE
ncbi:hypothetical protein JIQ42_02659 [Leishmania sp. Namibia]|uniref:hypothetical protein n=1 Tax=Leishmania sp. Namibia TaxID=2802991 RepID=UPI001B499186|nr:hypothetical protein JIQ42_02659 [Leishmania sp. Namibia]